MLPPRSNRTQGQDHDHEGQGCHGHQGQCARMDGYDLTMIQVDLILMDDNPADPAVP